MPVSWTKRVSLNIVRVSRAFSANWQPLYHATDICKHNYNFLCFLAHGSNWSKTENGHACTLGQIHFVTWQIAEHGQVSPCSVCKSLSCARRHVSAQMNNCKSVWGQTLHMWAEIHFMCSRLNLDVWQRKKIQWAYFMAFNYFYATLLPVMLITCCGLWRTLTVSHTWCSF